MEIKLHNSLTNKTETFKPLQDNLVRLYSCGPTVYNFAHIGNMRAFLFADLLQRVLRVVGGYDLKWVMNITNIDDKTIRDSAIGSDKWMPDMGEQTDDPKKNLQIFTKYYEESFLNDISTLGINVNDFYALPRATEYIYSMQDLIRNILDKGFGYISEGSVYFNLEAYRHEELYGKLKKIDFENFKSGARIDADQYDREQVSDFVLWKAKKPGEPYWEFEINGERCDGRPGWHLECSTMEHDILGLPFDIHTGGVDLKFPHHEDEIAQSKAGYGIEPTVFWLHNEFLQIESEKMSKSLGNVFTLRDLLAKDLDPLDIRFAMLCSHYGSTLNFTFDGLKSSHKGRSRIQEYIYQLHDEKYGSNEANVDKLRNDVYSRLANDLHTPKALAYIFSFMNDHEPHDLTEGTQNALIDFFTDMNHIFGIWEIGPRKEEGVKIPEEVKEMAEKRHQKRKNKNFAEADRLRDEIRQRGYVIEDTKDSYKIEPVSIYEA